MIFVDSNIPMYLVGQAHPNKITAQQTLERLVANGARLVTDAEVLQEILHRYVAIDRRDAIQPAFDLLLNVVDEVFDVGATAVQRAREIVLANLRLSARDALHVAVMERHAVSQIMTFDDDFDGIPGIARV